MDKSFNTKKAALKILKGLGTSNLKNMSFRAASGAIFIKDIISGKEIIIDYYMGTSDIGVDTESACHEYHRRAECVADILNKKVKISKES